MSNSTDSVFRRTNVLTLFRGHWGLIVAAALLLWFTFPTFIALNTVWSNIDYSHGYLVLGLTVLLAVSGLRRGKPAAPSPSWTGLVCLVVLALLMIAARVTSTQIVELLAWPLCWIAAIWACAGWQNARLFVLPFSYLLVAIPVWDVFIEPLQRLTVDVVSIWIRMAGMPAFIEGNTIHVPDGTFEVVGGCAGLRYTLVALALAGFAGLYDYRRWRPTVVLTLFAVTLAAIGNWLRVFAIVAVGPSSEGLFATFVRANDHTLFGWVVFIVFMIPVFLVHRRLQIHARPVRSDMLAAAQNEKVVRSRSAVPSVSCAVLALAVWLTLPMNAREAESPRTASLENPEIAGWTREGHWQDPRLPVFEGAAAHDATWYADGAARVGAYVVAFAEQGEGREAVSFGNRLTGASDAAVVVARQKLAVPTVAGATIPFLELEVSEAGNARRLVWVGWRIAGSLTVSDLEAKLFQLSGVVRGRRDAQALVLTAVCSGTCDEARSLLSRFAGAAAGPLYEGAERAVLAGQIRPRTLF